MAREPLRASRRSPRFPRVPGYEIESVLGRGATGVVYRARQVRVGREVALKVLHPELAAQPRIVQRLQREARTTARLAHPHLVTAVDMGETEGRWWYAMEYVDGPSLSLRLREEGRLKEREALRLFIPLCEALEHLFEHGVVHRDIKPANILLDRTGGARLADLGLAFDDEDDEELTKQGGTLGTPAYISPEQAVDPRDADVQSDIWSFGATLFHAVCGRPPFRAESAAEVLSCVLYARVPHPQELAPNLSRGLSLVLRKCLTREREHRYATPAELLADLELVRERRAPRIRRGQLDPVRRRHDPKAVWGVVGAIAVVALVAAGWALRWGRGDAAGGGDEVPAAVAPFAPLEELAARAGGDPPLFAQQLSELEAMEEALPPVHRARFEEVRDDLRGRLRAEARALGDRTQRSFDAALAARDFVRAREVIGEGFDRELLARTGFTSAGLETERSLKPLGPWRARNVAAVEAAQEDALRSLRGALARLQQTRFDHVERQLERQEWKAARRELLVDGDELLAEAGGVGIRFPEEALGAVLDPVLLAFEVRRQRLDDAWVRLDHELRRAVITRSEALERELEEAGKRYPPASVELRETFTRLLRARRLEPEQMPEGLAHVAVAELEKRAAELVRIEDRLLEEAARRAFTETERLTRVPWRDREYRAVLRIWDERARGLDDPGGLRDAPWRGELAQKASLRREEARRLRGLLEAAARRVGELNGQPIDLWVDGIRRENRRVEAGVDPLQDGFRIEGLARRLDLRTLAASELEILAGLGSEEGLDPEERLLVGLLRFRDGDLEGAERILRAGELPLQGVSGDLALDLSVRVSEAVLIREERRGSRAQEALRLLGLATNPDRIAREPRSVVLWIDELLEKYADVPAVTARQDELTTLRERLRPGAVRARPRDEDYEREFHPTRFAQEFPDRVRLEFDFAGEAVGAWERGDWVFENRGWSPDPASAGTSLADLRRQRGPTLLLKWPLDAGAGEVDLSFSIEQPAADPTRLVTLSAAGFHVAFVGTHLPGQGADHRLLVATGTFEDFLRRLEAGEGTVRSSLLRRGAAHEITLRMIPRSGKITVLLDGAELASSQLPRPDTRVARIVLRSLERTSLRHVTITAPR